MESVARAGCVEPTNTRCLLLLAEVAMTRAGLPEGFVGDDGPRICNV